MAEDMMFTAGLKGDGFRRGAKSIKDDVDSIAKSVAAGFKFGAIKKATADIQSFAMDGLRMVAKDSWEAQKALKALEGGVEGLKASIGRDFAFAINSMGIGEGGALTKAWNWWSDTWGTLSVGTYRAMTGGQVGYDPTGPGSHWVDLPTRQEMVDNDKENAAYLARGKLGRDMKEQLRDAKEKEALAASANQYDKERLEINQQYEAQMRKLDELNKQGVIVDGARAEYAKIRDAALARVDKSQSDDLRKQFDEYNSKNTDYYDKRRQEMIERQRQYDELMEDTAIGHKEKLLNQEEMRTGETRTLAEKRAALELEKEILEINRQQLLTQDEKAQRIRDARDEYALEVWSLGIAWKRKDADKMSQTRTLGSLGLGRAGATELRQIFGPTGSQVGSVPHQQLSALLQIAKNTLEIAHRREPSAFAE